jgi:hypothetical protein
MPPLEPIITVCQLKANPLLYGSLWKSPYLKVIYRSQGQAQFHAIFTSNTRPASNTCLSNNLIKLEEPHGPPNGIFRIDSLVFPSPKKWLFLGRK